MYKFYEHQASKFLEIDMPKHNNCKLLLHKKRYNHDSIIMDAPNSHVHSIIVTSERVVSFHA